MKKSPWSKIPVLPPEDQKEYDKMRQKVALQARIDDFDVQAMVDPPEFLAPTSFKTLADVDNVIDFLDDLFRKNGH